MATVQTIEKKVIASRLYYFDFSQMAELLKGGTLTGVATVTCDSPELVISAIALNPTNNAQIQCRISGGVQGKIYKLLCGALTAAGDTLPLEGSMSAT